MHAPCPVGKSVLGAGGRTWDPKGVLDGIRPSADLSQVVLEAYHNEIGTPLPPEVTAVAAVICVDPVPLQQRVAVTTVMSSSGLKAGSAACPTGTIVHSIAADINNGYGEVQLGVMAPTTSRTGTGSAYVKAWEDATGYEENWSLTAIAICAA